MITGFVWQNMWKQLHKHRWENWFSSFSLLELGSVNLIIIHETIYTLGQNKTRSNSFLNGPGINIWSATKCVVSAVWLNYHTLCTPHFQSMASACCDLKAPLTTCSHKLDWQSRACVLSFLRHLVDRGFLAFRCSIHTVQIQSIASACCDSKAQLTTFLTSWGGKTSGVLFSFWKHLVYSGVYCLSLHYACCKFKAGPMCCVVIPKHGLPHVLTNWGGKASCLSLAFRNI